METTELNKYRTILEKKRDELLAATPARTPTTEPGSKSGDWIDQSSQESDLHVHLAMKQTDTKLLRAIEEGKVTSVGADRPVEIDVRFIATTNKDLQSDVERGAFRRDLFYRLSVMPVRVPALRERLEDIPLLAHHFLREAGRRLKRVITGIASESLQALMRYPWPGNVRELENVIERAVIVSKGEVLTELERFLAGPGGAHAPVDLSLPFRDAKARIVEEFERAYVQGLLETHGGKLTAAAKHADMDPKNFSDKMARYGLRRQAAESGDGGARAT